MRVSNINKYVMYILNNITKKEKVTIELIGGIKFYG